MSYNFIIIINSRVFTPLKNFKKRKVMKLKGDKIKVIESAKIEIPITYLLPQKRYVINFFFIILEQKLHSKIKIQ